MDNFSKTYGAYFPRSTTGAYHDCLWAGFAVRRFKSSEPQFKLHFRRLEHRGRMRVASAMPKYLFNERMVSGIKEAMKKVDALGNSIARKSLVNQFDVRRLPCDIIITPKLDVYHPAIAQRIREGRVDRDFYTSHLEATNPGSNAGLAKLVRQIYDDNKKWTTRGQRDMKYKLLCCDVNIYHRIMKVHLECWCVKRRMFRMRSGYFHVALIELYLRDQRI